MYQLMKVYKDGTVGQSGRTHNQLNRLKKRLAKLNKGWILKLGEGGGNKQVIVARGFSKQAMKAIQTVGVEVLA